MTTASWAGPRRSVEDLAAHHGRDTVVHACIDLLAQHDVEGDLIFGLGGPPAQWSVRGGEPGPDYWLRVWALRGLLWLWDDTAAESVLASLADEAWRVREMAAKVVARHLLDQALPYLAPLHHDPVARVRRAAERAVIRLAKNGR